MQLNKNGIYFPPPLFRRFYFSIFHVLLYIGGIRVTDVSLVLSPLSVTYSMLLRMIGMPVSVVLQSSIEFYQRRIRE